MKKLFLSVGAVAVGMNTAFAATTITVDPSVGEETATTVKTIEAAFDLISADGDTILVRPGTYYLTHALTNTVKNLTFRSATAATGEIDRENTIIDGSLSGQRAFWAKNIATPTIDGFTFRNFRQEGSGVVYLYNVGAYVVRNCVFSDNEATNATGAAVFSYTSNKGVVSNCVFVGNHVIGTVSNGSYGGGAIATQQNSESANDYCSVIDCAFTNNSASGNSYINGGAVYAQRGIRLLQCTFVDNWVHSSGHNPYGGSVNAGCASVISNCTFSARNTSVHGNSYVNGHLLRLGRGGNSTPETGSHTIIGCTFGPVENIGTSGVGLVIVDSEVSNELVVDCTFRGLSSSHTPFALNAVVSGTMRNCLFAENTASTLVGAGSTGSTWTYENCTFVNVTEGVAMKGAKVSTFVNCLSNCNPPEGATVTTSIFAGTADGCGFVRSGVGDYRLAASSPAVDAGTSLAWHADAQDIGGRPRVVNTVDIGAYERQSTDPEKYYVRAVAAAADKVGEWVDAFIGIQPAVDAALNGDTLLVKAGTYRVAEPLNIQNRGLTVKGAGIDETVVDAQLGGRCLVAVISTAGLGNLTFDGFTFANGCAGDDTSDANYKARGGGVYLSCSQSGSRIALSNCRVTGCRALQPLDASGNVPSSGNFRGAGLYAVNYCTFTGCLFDDNLASNTYAAAIGVEAVGRANERDAGMFFSDCVISNCISVGKEGSTCAQCAGLYSFSGSAPILWIENTLFVDIKGNKYNNALYLWPGSTVTNCTFRRCQASYTVIHCQTDSSRFIDCTFENNSGYGVVTKNAHCERCVFTENSSIWFQNDVPYARNCLFTKMKDNIFRAQAAGNLSALFENCTFVGNKAALASMSSADNNSITFKNCILWGNRTAQGAAVNNVANSSGKETHHATFANCLVEDYACQVSYDAEGCIVGKDPRFVDAENGDYRLKHASPARDAATPLGWMTAATLDLGKNPRVVTDGKPLAENPGALPDIGCYENQDITLGMMLLVL